VVLRMNAARSPRAAGGASDVGEPARRMCVKSGRTGCGRRKNSKRTAKVMKTGGRVTVGQGVWYKEGGMPPAGKDVEPASQGQERGDRRA
jgi:hypothetical protein